MRGFLVLMFVLPFFSNFSCKSIDSFRIKDKSVPMEKIEDVAYRVLSENAYSAFAQKTRDVYVARSLAEVIAISEGNEGVISLCERVDFQKEAVMFALGGECTTSGYRVVIKSVRREKGRVRVLFSVSSPETSDVVTQALTNPSLVIAIGADKADAIEASFGE